MTATALLFVGCSERASGATLEERGRKYWGLKQAKQWEELYDHYLDPVLKDTLSRDAFLKKRLLAFDILSYAITEARENGDQGTVKVKGEANIPARGIRGAVRIMKTEITVEDQWVRRDGVWYVRLAE